MLAKLHTCDRKRVAKDGHKTQSTHRKEFKMKSFKHFLYLTICTLTMPLVVYAGPVDVNTADAETISAELQGVGLSKALAIVDYRKAHGPFKSADDLTMVKGIGERTVEINRANILVKSSEKSKKK